MEKQNQKKESSIKGFRISPSSHSFNFTELPNSERLSYEMLNQSNYMAVYTMFKNDDNPFVIKEYKEIDKLKQYVDVMLNYTRNTSKNAGCDWLVKHKQTGNYISIINLINLYELKRETFNNYHKKCMIGFTTEKNHRQKYYTLEAVKNLIDYAIDHFGMELIIADTNKKNEVSKNFLRKLGFADAENKYYYSDIYDFFEYIPKQ